MPKRYPVEIVPSAELEITWIRDFIAQDKPQAAAKWASGIRRHIRSLRTLPERYEIIPEAVQQGEDYRHVIYGNYRIIYRIDPGRVIVLRVIHAARRLRLETLRDA